MTVERGPAAVYEIIWRDGTATHISAHQVDWPGTLSFLPGKQDQERRVRFMAEVDGHWTLLLDVLWDKIESVRNISIPSPGVKFSDRESWKNNLLFRVGYQRLIGKRNVAFSVYRRGDISDTHNESQVNAPDEVQFDGVIFDDGVTVIHWNTAIRSTSVFKDFDDLLEIHGHPEPAYATEFVFEGEK